MLRISAKSVLYIVLFSSLLSCANNWNYQSDIEIVEEEAKIILFTKPNVEIYYAGDNKNELELALLSARFIEYSIGRFNGMTKPSSAVITIDLRQDNNLDLYYIFYKLGNDYLSGFQNKGLSYALIQLEWEDMIFNSFDKNDFISLLLQREKNSYFRIEDFDRLFSEYQISDSDMILVGKYIVNFLLNDILFISIQEFQEKEEIYFGTSEIDTIFFQAVVMAEMTEFTRYIIHIYGKKTALKLAKREYNNSEWTKLLGLEINEAEKEFADMIETISFEGIFTNREFTKKLDELLILYNTTTRETMVNK